MQDAKVIKVVCQRFDPMTDETPYSQTYEVPLVDGMSVLNVLTSIYEEMDPGLAFYSCCDRGVCGRCTLMVNSRPALSCTTLVDGDLDLGPLKGKRIIRDLLVDL